MKVSPLFARLSAARGPKVSLPAGTLVIAIGYALSVFMLDAVWKIVAMAVFSAVGVALTYTAMPSLIMQAVPIGETGSTTGLNTLMRSIGTSTSSAVIGVALANITMRAGGRGYPSYDAFVTAPWLGCRATVLGLLVALFIPGANRSKQRRSRHGIERTTPRRSEPPADGASIPVSYMAKTNPGSRCSLSLTPAPTTRLGDRHPPLDRETS
jgi:MFS family permease